MAGRGDTQAATTATLGESMRPDAFDSAHATDTVATRIADDEADRLVARAQAGDHDAFAALYSGYFDAVYGYLRIVFNDPHEAESGAQQVFLNIFEELPRYEPQGKPFRAWLFTLGRNFALNHLRKLNRSEPEDPAEVTRRRDERLNEQPDLSALTWVTDSGILMFVERLPLIQRQILVLRFMLDIKPAEMAGILNRSPNEIRIHQHRALKFLKARLTSIGQDPTTAVKDRTGWQRRGKQARTLRNRRYALIDR